MEVGWVGGWGGAGGVVVRLDSLVCTDKWF